MNLTPVGLGRRQSRLELENEIDRLREGRAQHAFELLDKCVQVERGETGLSLTG